MATLEDREWSDNYRDLVQTGGAAVAVFTLCLVGFETMRRLRRGKGRGLKYDDGLGSIETWEAGYLYQARYWAKRPALPHPKWPLAWIWPVIKYPESQIPELVGLDAAVYSRFLRACWLFVLLHTCTTLPTLLPIHVIYSPEKISTSSMQRASLSALVAAEEGRRLLSVHLVMIYWLAITWMGALFWVARGAFEYQNQVILSEAQRISHDNKEKQEGRLDTDTANRGMRLRTIMVSNVPPQLRNEQELREYFQYHLSRPIIGPANSPGIIPRIISFLFSRAVQNPAIARVLADPGPDPKSEAQLVERVIMARKMTELASQLERREEVLSSLERAHIKLANNVLSAVKVAMEKRAASSDRLDPKLDVEHSAASEREEKTRMDRLIQVLGPFVEDFGLQRHQKAARPEDYAQLHHSRNSSSDNIAPPGAQDSRFDTVWEALHSLPRSYLDPYQPLIRLSALFRGATVTEIDYFVTKFGLLTALVHDNRSRPIDNFVPSSTAFVTFHDAHDAARACKYLPSHPMNPLACIVAPAPYFRDLTWERVMKTTFTGEFLKDWVINAGVWGFTLFWVIPVSLLVTLVSITNLAKAVPAVDDFLRQNSGFGDVLRSLIPVLIVTLLGILIPLLLLLIAKKGHSFVTISTIEDRVLSRYHKFLVCNVLIFFCVGVSALESFLESFQHPVNPFPIIAQSFPTAGPFYVGWLMFQTGMSGGLELLLLGLPMIFHALRRARIVPRGRLFGTQPRTFSIYFWLPNHVLIMTITQVFAVLNPLVIPFSLVYYSFMNVIIKNQFLHVYQKFYELHGRNILIRAVRYSCDSLLIAQVVFLAFLVILRTQYPEQGLQITILLGLTGVLMIVTTAFKLFMTRLCRAKFDEADKELARVYRGKDAICSPQDAVDPSALCLVPSPESKAKSVAEPDPEQILPEDTAKAVYSAPTVRFWTWRVPQAMEFSYSSQVARGHHMAHRPRNPFQPPRGEPPSVPMVPETAEAGENTLPQRYSTILFEVPASPISSDGIELPGTVPLVRPHKKRQPWDDRPPEDKPYENPAYRSVIDNFLWLPRNPCDVTDLDDTVDLHKALTSEPGTGQLGDWLEQTSSTVSDSVPEFTRTGKAGKMERELSGRETIVLPSAIMSRIDAHEAADTTEGDKPYFFTFRRKPVPPVDRRSFQAGHTPPAYPSVRPDILPLRLWRGGRLHTIPPWSQTYIRKAPLLNPT